MSGYLSKRGKDSWTLQISAGFDPLTGKRRRITRTVKGTKAEAQRALTQLQAQIDSGVDLPPGKITVADVLDRWLKTHALQNCAPRTYRRYEGLIRVHVTPVIGNLPLAKLRAPHIQAVHQHVLDAGCSNRTALHAHRVLHTAFAHAVRWQLLSRNPCDSVQAPRPERFEIPAIEPEQVRALFSAADSTPYGTLVNVAVLTGLRLSELLGLRWQDTNLESRTLFVRQTCQWHSRDGFMFRQPKSYRSIRPVSIAPTTAERLRQHRVAQLEQRLAAGSVYQDNELVFSDAIGRPIHPSTLRLAWKRITRTAGLPRLRFHDLRHASATLMLQQGIHPKVVQERLGHSTINITLDTYSHVLPSLQVDAAEQLDDLLRGAS